MTQPTDPQPAPPAPPAPPTQNVEDLPDWARKAITDANAEAARFRVQNREFQAKLEGAKTQQEFEAATAELKAMNAKLERDLLVAKVAKGDPEKKIPALPDAVAALLQGNTEEELRAHAETLRGIMGLAPAGPPPPPAPPTKLGGGLDPTQQGDGGFDPKAIAKDFRRRL